jgi:hypothetical protein
MGLFAESQNKLPDELALVALTEKIPKIIKTSNEIIKLGDSNIERYNNVINNINKKLEAENRNEYTDDEEIKIRNARASIEDANEFNKNAAILPASVLATSRNPFGFMPGFMPGMGMGQGMGQGSKPTKPSQAPPQQQQKVPPGTEDAVKKAAAKQNNNPNQGKDGNNTTTKTTDNNKTTAAPKADAAGASSSKTASSSSSAAAASSSASKPAASASATSSKPAGPGVGAKIKGGIGKAGASMSKAGAKIKAGMGRVGSFFTRRKVGGGQSGGGEEDNSNNITRKNRQYIHEIKENRTQLFNKEMEIINSIRNFKHGSNEHDKNKPENIEKKFIKVIKRS